MLTKSTARHLTSTHALFVVFSFCPLLIFYLRIVYFCVLRHFVVVVVCDVSFLQASGLFCYMFGACCLLLIACIGYLQCMYFLVAYRVRCGMHWPWVSTALLFVRYTCIVNWS